MPDIRQRGYLLQLSLLIFHKSEQGIADVSTIPRGPDKSGPRGIVETSAMPCSLFRKMERSTKRVEANILSA